VLPHSGLTTPALAASASLAIDIRRFPWVRPLVSHYAFDYARLAEFYAGDPADRGAWREAIARTQQHSRARAAVAELVQAQQRGRGAPAEALAAGERLRDPRTVAIVTGQQAGLFGGPLFTLLKALTAVRLAEQVGAEHHVPTVAVFWIDAEDHDWDEVKSCTVLDRELTVRSVAVDLPHGQQGGAIARVRLDQSVETAVAALEAILPPTEFSSELTEQLRGAYRPGMGMAQAFARWLESLLGARGLVVYDSADPAAKPLVSDLFAQEVERAGETARLATHAGSALQARGYHAQATPQAGSLALFHHNGGRDAIRTHGADTFLVGDREVSKAELLKHVRQSPADFSPSVLLRPLVQDTLFPTACYVAGPSELAYLGQLKEVYAAFGLPMPLMQQRATATIVDSNAMRFLSRHPLPLEALRAQDEAALNELLSDRLPPAVDESLGEMERTLEARMLTLVQAVTQVDPTLEGAARSTLTRLQDDLKKLQSKIIQAAKRKDDTLRRQFRHAQAQAFPDGQPQERALGFVYFLDKFGPALVDRVAEIVPGERGTHYVLTI
jgi:bacillithiol biosynthesis cysteine-adding enzyme BshC